MAMIMCPNCGEQISDQAKKCVHCGALLVSEEPVICSECGTEVDEGAEICPNCGCPLDQKQKSDIQEKPQKVEVTGVKVTKRVKTAITIVIVALIVVAVSTLGVNQYQKKKEAEAYAQRVEAYGSNLEMATYSMLLGASDAESCGNLIKQVWYNAIYGKRDEATDKYTVSKGLIVSDFNIALGNLFSDTDFQKKINSVEENQKSVNSLMKELKDPPEEYEDAYESISELYDAYISLTNLAVDPSGSFQSFSDSFNAADTETLNCYKAMKLYLEE